MLLQCRTLRFRGVRAIPLATPEQCFQEARCGLHLWRPPIISGTLGSLREALGRSSGVLSQDLGLRAI